MSSAATNCFISLNSANGDPLPSAPLAILLHSFRIEEISQEKGRFLDREFDHDVSS